MKKLLKLFPLLMLLILGACDNDDDGPKLNPDTPIYLTYQVDFYGQSVNAFATFRAYGPTGTIVPLNNGASILCNAQDMWYSGEGTKEGFYDYFREITERDTRVIFTFTRRKGVKNVTEVPYSALPEFEIPADLSVMKNNTPYDFPPAGDDFTASDYTRIEAELISGSSADLKTYPANIGGGKIFFSGVPAGAGYALRVIKYRDIPILKDAACEGGKVIVTRTVTKGNITVE